MNVSNEELLPYLLKLVSFTLDPIKQLVPKIKPRNRAGGYKKPSRLQFNDHMKVALESAYLLYYDIILVRLIYLI